MKYLIKLVKIDDFKYSWELFSIDFQGLKELMDHSPSAYGTIDGIVGNIIKNLFQFRLPSTDGCDIIIMYKLFGNFIGNYGSVTLNNMEPENSWTNCVEIAIDTRYKLNKIL